MNKKTLIFGLGALVLAGGGACGRTQAVLSPAPDATLIGGPGRGAVASAAGVRVSAHTGAWQWGPADLDTKVTPILIDLANDGTAPILIRYNRIALTDSLGHRFAAMPPYDTRGTLTEAYTVRTPIYGFDRFEIAPYLSRWYPRFARYDGAFAYDPAYYTPYVTAYQRVNLPTADMVQRALPEGVLSPGGRASGFVYFEPLDRDARTLVLRVDIIDARTDETLGTARIPFIAH